MISGNGWGLSPEDIERKTPEKTSTRKTEQTGDRTRARYVRDYYVIPWQRRCSGMVEMYWSITTRDTSICILTGRPTRCRKLVVLRPRRNSATHLVTVRYGRALFSTATTYSLVALSGIAPQKNGYFDIRSLFKSGHIHLARWLTNNCFNIIRIFLFISRPIFLL